MRRHAKALLGAAVVMTAPLWFIPALALWVVLFIPAMAYASSLERKK